MSDAPPPNTTTTTPPTPPTPPPNTGVQWHSGLDAQVVAKAQLKGWDLSDATKAFAAATQAYTAAEQHLGAPADQLLRLPKDQNDEAGWRAVHTRLGAPEKPDGYKFEGFNDEAKPMLEKIGAEAHRLGLSTKQAQEMVNFMHKELVAGPDAADAATREAAIAADRAELDKLWGTNKPANSLVAQRAAQALAKAMGGQDVLTQAINALEGQVGYSKVMEMMRVVGLGLGEDKFVGGNPGNGGALTVDQAIARRSELMGNPMRPNSGDKAWQTRYYEGDIQARREMEMLNRIISSS
jgi:hypothetical protein